MKKEISDRVIDYAAAIACLELSGEDRIQTKREMEKMLSYIDCLNELDTSDVEPLCHVVPMQNVFREDIVTNGDESGIYLQSAPCRKDNLYKAPGTF